MIECGWCGQTSQRDRCSHCGRNPVVPWFQRGLVPREIRTDAVGRPALDVEDIRRRLAAARKELGDHPTIEALAERLDVSSKTVRRWQRLVGDQ